MVLKSSIGFGKVLIYRFTYIYNWLQTGVKNTIFKRLEMKEDTKNGNVL